MTNPTGNVHARSTPSGSARCRAILTKAFAC